MRAVISLALLTAALPAAFPVTTADYDRALGLRARWTYLTENVPEPAIWAPSGNHFYYRKSVKGGHQYVVMDAETRERRPAFDHDPRLGFQQPDAASLRPGARGRAAGAAGALVRRLHADPGRPAQGGEHRRP